LTKSAITSTFALAAFACSIGGFSTAAALGQTTPTPAPAATASSSRHTVVSEQYDGKTHMGFTPYVWLPTVNGTFGYNTPRLPRAGGIPGEAATLNLQVGPNSYLTHINFAFMGYFEVRKNDVAAFTDYIHLNVSNGASYVTSVSGPKGNLVVPIDLGTTGRLTSSIWEAGGALTLAHSDDASIEFLTAWRQVTLNGTLNWNINVGKNSVIARTGTALRRDNIGDVVFGLRGKIAIGNGGWYLPYYTDVGAGAPSNATWQAYGGIGKATKNGAFLLGFRELNYDFGTGASFVQKIRFGGPLLGYTFKF
jgi:hypothetical protein